MKLFSVWWKNFEIPSKKSSKHENWFSEERICAPGRITVKTRETDFYVSNQCQLLGGTKYLILNDVYSLFFLLNMQTFDPLLESFFKHTKIWRVSLVFRRFSWILFLTSQIIPCFWRAKWKKKRIFTFRFTTDAFFSKCMRQKLSFSLRSERE